MATSLLLLVLHCITIAKFATSIREDQVTIRAKALETIEEVIVDEVLYQCLQPATVPELAASSCHDISVLRSNYSSGYYWLRGEAGPVGVYCDLTGSKFGRKGGWMQVAGVNGSNLRYSFCSPGLKFVAEPKPACTQPQPGGVCPSKLFPVHGIEYRTVCGRVLARQEGTTDGFDGFYTHGSNIDGVYFDGVSLTHGNPRQHIWSFAGTKYPGSACPCTRDTHGLAPLPFVGVNYFCESGSTSLWDGHGCSINDHCCQKGGPWFCTSLPQPTRDDIELRICSTGSDEKFYLEEIEVYVQ